MSEALTPPEKVRESVLFQFISPSGTGILLCKVKQRRRELSAAQVSGEFFHIGHRYFIIRNRG